MSKDVFESLTNGTGLQNKLTGIPSSDNTVSNYIPPRDCLSALMCHDGTTSKTILSYDSKFNTTADQTTKYKDTTTNLPYENVPTSPKQIKSDIKNLFKTIMIDTGQAITLLLPTKTIAQQRPTPFHMSEDIIFRTSRHYYN